MADIRFEAEIVAWRGPPPYLFAIIPERRVGDIRYASLSESYGWGVVPVVAKVGNSEFETSLFPRNGTICCRSRSRCNAPKPLASATASP